MVDALFNFTCKVFIAGFQTVSIFTDQVSKTAVLRVDVLNSFINSVLSNIFRRELVIIASSASERHRVVHVIYVLLSPLSKVAHETIQVMTFRHVDCTVFVVV